MLGTFILFVTGVVIALLALNILFAVNNPTGEKTSPYECGFLPSGASRDKFNISFFLVAILFLIFDLEILFLYPFAVSFTQVSIYGYWVVVIFLFILTVGFIYEFGTGALSFTDESTP